MGCKLVESDKSELDIQRQRVKEWEAENSKKPNDVKIVMICGNRECIAVEHMRLTLWENWAKKKGQPPEVPPPASVVSNWRLVQIAKSPWLALTEEENESVVRELIQHRKEKK